MDTAVADVRHCLGVRQCEQIAVHAEDVVGRIRAGDDSAFELLFRMHYSALSEFAARYVKDDALAEELVQDLFADLWARRRAWAVPESVRAYHAEIASVMGVSVKGVENQLARGLAAIRLSFRGRDLSS
jgi:DNA-directed RNA polymerase specialized sigma24 family protein